MLNTKHASKNAILQKFLSLELVSKETKKYS